MAEDVASTGRNLPTRGLQRQATEEFPVRPPRTTWGHVQRIGSGVSSLPSANFVGAQGPFVGHIHSRREQFRSTGSSSNTTRLNLSNFIVGTRKRACGFQRVSGSGRLNKSLSQMPWLRRHATRIMESMVTDLVVIIVIVFNFVLICLDTDFNAELHSVVGSSDEAPFWVQTGLAACFIFYIAELLARIFVERRAYFDDSWNRFDLLVVACGIVEYSIQLGTLHLTGMGAIRVVHLMRLLRLLRVFRLFSVLKDLRTIMQLFAGCLRAVIWSFVLLLMIMTIWACIMVELVHPIVTELAADEYLDGSIGGQFAFSTVFRANLTLIQTIVAHDSWGSICIPVIEAQPWTVIIFFGALVTIGMGVLNLVLAVIVDACAETNAADFRNKALDLEEAEVLEKRVLSKMFQEIDEDASGSLSWEELQKGSEGVPDFNHWLRAMDVDSEDLYQLFTIVDQDGSGLIDHDEFTEVMYRLKNVEARTTAKLTKHLIVRMEREQRDTRAVLELMKGQLAVALAHSDSHAHSIEKVVAQSQAAFAAELRDQERRVLEGLEAAVRQAAGVAREAAADVQELPGGPALAPEQVEGADDKCKADLPPELPLPPCPPAPLGPEGEADNGLPADSTPAPPETAPPLLPRLEADGGRGGGAPRVPGTSRAASYVAHGPPAAATPRLLCQV